jgi:hypothetical protein
VAFYVPLGPRGLLFRLGTFVIGIWGGLVYRLACRHRAIMVPCPGPFPSRGHGTRLYTGLDVAHPIPSGLLPASLLTESEAAAMA